MNREDILFSALKTCLNQDFPGWQVEKSELVGPGTLGLSIEDQHDADSYEGHVDFGFILNRNRPDAPVIWDCIAGIGPSLEQKLENAVDTWSRCTLPVVTELLKQTGEHATHLSAHSEEGLKGWHIIHGPLMSFGKPEQRKELMTWIQQNPILPQLASEILSALDRPLLNGLKFLFGSKDLAELRVNGVAHDECSKALAALDWPRANGPGYLRFFILAVHPDSHEDEAQ